MGSRQLGIPRSVVKDYGDGDAEHTMVVTGDTDGHPVSA
jgi:hypothetical protein